LHLFIEAAMDETRKKRVGNYGVLVRPSFAEKLNSLPSITAAMIWKKGGSFNPPFSLTALKKHAFQRRFSLTVAK
jgi:hypothetical protein